MDQITVEALSLQTNAAIIRLPGRSFPGMVMQGDTLRALLGDIEEVQQMVAGIGRPELEEAVRALHDNIAGRLRFYERTLDQHGIKKPY